MGDRPEKKKSAAPEKPSDKAPTLSISDIKELFVLMKENEIAEVDLEQKGTKIHIVSTHAPQQLMQPTASQPIMPMMPQVMNVPQTGTAAQPPAQQQSQTSAPQAQTEPAVPANQKTILSPMVGTFYRSPAPDSPAFVQVGDTVNEETVLCIIEAMKLMNELKAETKGKIVKILVENGNPVEYNQPLFLLEPA